MLPYDEAEKAVIKSNLHVGANRPLAEVTVVGQPVADGVIDPTDWTTWQKQGDSAYIGNCASNVNGTPVMVFRDGDSSTVSVAFGASWDAILGGTDDFNFAAKTDITTSKYRAIPRVTLDGAELFLSLTWFDTTNTKIICEFWKDSTGVGDSFAYVSTVSDNIEASSDISSAATWNYVTEIKKLITGKLVTICHWDYVGNGGMRAYVSTDNGASWVAGGENGYLYDRRFQSGIIELDSGYWGVLYYQNSGRCYFAYWDGSGSTFMQKSLINWPLIQLLAYASMCRIGDNFYLAGVIAQYSVNNVFLEYIGVKPVTPQLIADYNNWEIKKIIPSMDGSRTKCLFVCGDYLVLSTEISSSASNYFYICGCKTSRYSLPVKSVDIEPIKCGAGQATIVIDNKNGAYAPDSTGDWYHILWPNKAVSAKLGYGANIEAVFAGLIDSVDMQTFPQELTIQARDNMKRALDQTVTSLVGKRSITYTNKSLEYIFTDLAIRAGWDSADIHCDSSGITISTITFTHETYADAFQKLCDGYNFEYYCGRSSEIYFHYVTDRQPEAADEAVVLSGTTAVELVKYPIVTSSIRVRSAASGGGTLYTKDTDYAIVEGDKDSAWTIARIAGGSITDGATVYVSYVYAAWVFEEGKDIFSLGYTLDDAELYRTVTVLGRTSTDTVCHGTATYSAADYYNLPADKVLIVEDDTATTSAECETIAARILTSFAAKARKVDFAAVGNPYLWVGDCIMVIETSSTISEIYRIESLRHSFSESGYTTSITACYYGYAPA